MEVRSSYPSDKRKYPENKFIKHNLQRGRIKDNQILGHKDSILSQVSDINLRSNVEFLSSFPTRHTKSRYINDAAEWIRSQLLSYGYVDIHFHEYTMNKIQLKNVICTKRGRNSRVTMICAHYDCIMEDIDNERERAPGANDNASGVSSLLEIARILQNVVTDLSIQFVFFSGEEQGLWGSQAYAQYVKEKNIPLNGLVNLDMIGSPPDNKNKVIIECDLGNQVSHNDLDSQKFAMVMEEMAMAFTNLEVIKGPIYSSDYMPFEALGYVVIGVYDGGQSNNHYHSTHDEPAQINFDYLLEVTKMVLATVLS